MYFDLVRQINLDSTSLRSRVQFVDIVSYRMYSVSRKKGDQNVFCNIFHKTQAILTKFGAPFPE